MPNTPMRLTPEGVTRWRRKDTWTIYETAFLLCGYEPPADMRAERQTPDEVREAAENMGRARIAGHLRTIGPEDDNGRKFMLRQRDVIAWAARNFPEFPFNPNPTARPRHTGVLPQIVLPADTLIVPTMEVAALIAQAFHPHADPSSTEYQAALRSHARMLNTAAREGAVQVISYHGESIQITTEEATGCAGAFLSVAELERYLAELQVPIALRTGELAAQKPGHAKRALTVSEQHADTVLEAIRAAGYEPMALPKREIGRRWVKAIVRKRCTQLTQSQFKKTWERLNAMGAIAESANPADHDAPEK